MKNISVIFVFLFNFNQFAIAECTQLEAQIIANVGLVLEETNSTCTVSLSFSAKSAQFNPSYICPLSVGEVSSGITLFKTNGEACPAKPGDFMSGVLFRTLAHNNSLIYLE